MMLSLSPLDLGELAQRSGMSLGLTLRAAENLVRSGLLVRIDTNTGGPPVYATPRPIDVGDLEDGKR